MMSRSRSQGTEVTIVTGDVFFYRDTVKILCKNVTLQPQIVSSSSFLTVSVKDKVTGEVSVRAVCHRSMKKSEKPHDLRVELC